MIYRGYVIAQVGKQFVAKIGKRELAGTTVKELRRAIKRRTKR